MYRFNSNKSSDENETLRAKTVCYLWYNSKLPWFCPRGRSGNYDIPNGVTAIDEGACWMYVTDSIQSAIWLIYIQLCDSRCIALTNVTIAEAMTACNIGEGAFANCNISWKHSIPDRVTGFGDYTFYGCKGMKLRNRSGVAAIGVCSFRYVTADSN